MKQILNLLSAVVLAVAIHGFPRATNDVDIIVCAEDLAAVRTTVKPLGYTIDGGFQTFRAGTDTEMKLWRISRAVDDELWTVDFLVVTDFLRDVWQEREIVEFDEVEISVVSIEGLKKMKDLSGRPQDLFDLEHLNNPDV